MTFKGISVRKFMKGCRQKLYAKAKAKKERLQRLPHICHPAKYQHYRASPRHTETRKPRVGQGVLTLLVKV